MSHVSKVKMSPSLCCQFGALECVLGMGDNERRNSSVRAVGQHAAHPTQDQTIPLGWRGCAPAWIAGSVRRTIRMLSGPSPFHLPTVTSLSDIARRVLRPLTSAQTPHATSRLR